MFLVFKRSSFRFVLIVLLCCVLLAINIGGGSFATVYLGYAPRKIPIYCVDTDQKKVAISFDSAWGADKTLSIIKSLQDFNVSATFFLVGFWVEKYPEMVQAIDNAGLEIGTHSNTHPDMTKLGSADIERELTTSISLIKQIISKPVKLFRAPFGAYDNKLLNVTEQLGLHTIQWDVDTLDWKGLSAMEITTRVLNRVKNGSIILCHNNADYIVDALPMILERLQMQGYEVGSVGSLILTENYYVDAQGIQRKK